MKRIAILAVIAVTAVLGSSLFPASDVAKLEPVEVIRIQMDRGQILVETDTGQLGRGADLQRAFADLKNRASGDIFLDTAEYVILTEDSRGEIVGLLDYLRPACRVCLEWGRADLQQVAAFLDIHEPELTIMDCQGGQMDLPALVTKEGRMELVP